MHYFKQLKLESGQLIDEMAINFLSPRNFVSMKNIEKKKNLTVDLSKFTSN